MTTLPKNAVAAAADYLDSWLAFRQRHLRVPGVQAAVLVEDEIVLATAHGHADLAAQTPLTPGHLFRIASHSKTFTATAILQLVESGQLRLDDPLRTHVPELPEKVGQIRVREVLGHVSGLYRDGEDADFWQLERPFLGADELRAITDEAAVLEPNERFKYSNIGYSLLGLVIEAASGVPYNDYVTTNIVKRLGLADTGPELDTARLADYATGYTATFCRDDRIPIEHVDTRGMSAATGFSSTASDVCRYAAAHFRGDTRLLADASKRLMQHEEWKVQGGDGGYGLGLSTDDIGDRGMVGHGGGYPGHATRTLLDPQDRIAVSVCTNAIDGPAEELATGLVKLIDLIRPGERPELARFTGRYANLWGVLDIVALGDRLVGIRPTQADPAQSPVELAVEAEDRLRITDAAGYAAPGETIRFEFDGDTVRAIHGSGGMTSHPIEEFREQMSTRDRVTVQK